MKKKTPYILLDINTDRLLEFGKGKISIPKVISVHWRVLNTNYRELERGDLYIDHSEDGDLYIDHSEDGDLRTPSEEILKLVNDIKSGEFDNTVIEEEFVSELERKLTIHLNKNGINRLIPVGRGVGRYDIPILNLKGVELPFFYQEIDIHTLRCAREGEYESFGTFLSNDKSANLIGQDLLDYYEDEIKSHFLNKS